MPIEIKELTIRTTINQEGGASDGSSATSQETTEGSSGEMNKADKEREALIQEAVERVLEILHYQKER